MTQTIVACKQCRHTLGSTDGEKLFVGAVVLPYAVTICCGRCGKKYSWQPGTLDSVPKGNDTVAKRG